MEVSKNEGIPWYTRKKTSIFMGFPFKKNHPGPLAQVGNGTHLGLQQFWLPETGELEHDLGIPFYIHIRSYVYA